MKSLLNANKHDLALVIGNGINRYEAPANTNSWNSLLTALARQHIDPNHQGIPNGVALTEFYDVLDLASRSRAGEKGLQQLFCDLMKDWSSLPQHTYVSNWASINASPVLTTNFEETLSTPVSAKRLRYGKAKFTAYYPWSTYFANKPIADPLTSFAIWHINGMQAYRQSVRLGLSHYMGSVERARSWLHKSGTRLFGATKIDKWAGSDSWLQVFFHKPLLFFGLGLEENEVFLRWLLIERAKYFKKYPERAKPGWFVFAGNSDGFDQGKRLFLEGVGIKPYAVATHQHIYSEDTWKQPQR
jgi:hypothetical protein